MGTGGVVAIATGQHEPKMWRVSYLTAEWSTLPDRFPDLADAHAAAKRVCCGERSRRVVIRQEGQYPIFTYKYDAAAGCAVRIC